MVDCLTYGLTILCQKDRTKGNAVDNYRPISCLQLLGKFQASIISEHLYRLLEEEKILPEEQKGCKTNSRGTKDQLLLDKTVFRDVQEKYKSCMVWIDCHKSYDMIPRSWISECHQVFGVAENTKKLPCKQHESVETRVDV